jgi:hypothetical protein
LNLKWLEGVSDRVIEQHLGEDHMSVIGPSCGPPSKDSTPCGCAPSTSANTKLAATASATALAAVACTTCCILPFTLPATLLALAGGSIAVLGYAHVLMSRLAIIAVVGAWLWIAWQRHKTRRPMARATIALMMIATLLTVTGASWPWLEPVVFKSMGIVKKKAVLQTG